MAENESASQDGRRKAAQALSGWLAREMAAAVDQSASGDLSSESAERAIDQCADLMSRYWPEDGRASCDGSSSNGIPVDDDARRLPPPHPALSHEGRGFAGERLGRFEVRRALGHGGFGVVFLVFDPRLNREAALKIPRPEILVSPPLRQRFLREAQSAAVLDHSGIVPIYETGEIGPVGYILSGYCKGPTLAQWFSERHEPVSARLAAEIVAQLACAVQHAHSRGILHRDIKPSNVLLEPITASSHGDFPFVPRLTDFGLAKRLDEVGDDTRRGAVLGTPRYMAPEQVAGNYREIGVQTDMYSLGVILYELLTGQPPFVGRTDSETLHLIAEHELSPSALRTRRVPRDLETIVLKCLEQDQAARYPSAGELAEDLRCFLTGEPVSARHIGSGGRLVRWCRRRPVIAALSLGLTVSLLMGAVIATWQWARAERNYVDAQAAATLAQQNLAQAEHALLDLAWLVEESSLWRTEHTPFERTIQDTLTRYQNALTTDAKAVWGSMPVAAVTHSFAARTAAKAGDLKSAMDEYRQALEMWSGLMVYSPDHAGYRRAFALTLLASARLRCQGARAAGSVDELAEARELLNEKAKDHRVPDTALRDYIFLAHEVGDKLVEEKQTIEAKTTYCLGRIGVEALLERNKLFPDLRYHEGRFSRLIGVEWQRQKNGDEALKEFKRSHLALRQAVTGDPSQQPYQRELARAYRAVGVFYRERRNYSEACLELASAVDLLEKLVAADAADLELKCELARMSRELAIADREHRGAREALPAFSRAHELLEEVRQQRELSDTDLSLLSHVAREEAILAQSAGQDERASEASVDATRAFDELAKRGQSNQRDQFQWAECLNVLGYYQMKKGDLAGAIKLHQAAIARIAPLAARTNANPRFRSAHADWQKKLNALKAKAAAQEVSPSESSSPNGS